MTKRIILSVTTLAVVSLLASSCAKLKPLQAQYVNVDPQPLELTAGKVPAQVNISFPKKWFAKKAQVSIIPVLRYQGGEMAAAPVTYQGEKVRGNATVVPYASAERVVFHTEFDYKPEMQKSDLFLTFRAKVGKKEVRLPDVKVGEGVIATEALASTEYVTPAIAPDGFQRIIKEAHNANILFLIQQAGLRPTELAKAEMKEWKSIVKNANDAANKNVNVEVRAYASPDGAFDLNERLAGQREKNTTNYLNRELKKQRINAPVAAHYTAEDWEGFKELVEKSEIQDKDLVLRVLSMYTDPVQREQEIKNISAVFRQLADDILPQLRRSRLIANVEIIGKSDEEILSLSQKNPAALNVEELLYSATLVPTAAEKMNIYKKATELFPNDARAWNNIGTILYASKEYANAAEYFNRALAVAKVNGKDLAEAQLNNGLLALRSGNVDQANSLFSAATNVPEMAEVMGLMQIRQGKYAEAAKTLSGYATNNAVVAQILANDYNKAAELIAEISNPDAKTFYLKALVAARTDNASVVEEALKEAVKLDPSIVKTIAMDREFSKYAANPFFKSILR